MANGQPMLPQSAIPLGQTPLQIRAPQVNATVPNPMDVTNFFRMQAGINDAIRTRQQAQLMELRKQELNQRIYESKVKEMDAIIGLSNQMFDDTYGAIQQSKSRSGGADPVASTLFSGLDPNNAGHHRVMKRLQGDKQALQAELDMYVKDYMASNSSDPAVRFEIVRKMRNAISNHKNNIMMDREYRDYMTQQQNFELWNEGIKAQKEAGKTVDQDAYQRRLQEYNDYVTAGPNDKKRSFTLGSWDVSNYVWDPHALKAEVDTYADEQIAQEFEEGSVIMETDAGDFVADRTRRLSRDQIIDGINKRFSDSRDFNKMYELARAKEEIPDQDGNIREYTRRDFIDDMFLKSKLPADLKTLSDTAKSSTPIKEPTAAAGSPGTAYPYQDLASGKVGNEGYVENLQYIDQKFVKAGVNPRGVRADGTPVTADDIEDMRTNTDRYRKTRFVDENGNKVAAGSDDAVGYQYYEEGFTSTDGVEVPDQIILQFPLGADEPVETGTPSGEYKIPPDQIPDNVIPITKDTLDAQGLTGYEFKQVELDNLAALNPDAIDLLVDLKNEYPEFNGLRVTDTFRTEEMNNALRNRGSSPNSFHLVGGGVDIDWENGGKELNDWLKTDEGIAFLDERDYEASFHGTGNNKHIHFEPKQSGEGGTYVDTSGVDYKVVKKMSPEQVYDKMEQEFDGTLNGNDRSLDIVDKLVMGLNTDDERVTSEDITYLLQNPPKGEPRFSKAVKGARKLWDAQVDLQERVDDLTIKQSTLNKMGRELPPAKLDELAQLKSKLRTFDDATTVEGFGELLRLELAKIDKDRNRQRTVEDFFDPGESNGRYKSTLGPGEAMVINYGSDLSNILEIQAGVEYGKRKMKGGAVVIREDDVFSIVEFEPGEDTTLNENGLPAFMDDPNFDIDRIKTGENVIEDFKKHKANMISGKSIAEMMDEEKMYNEYVNEAKVRYVGRRTPYGEVAETTEQAVEQRPAARGTRPERPESVVNKYYSQ